MTPITVLAVGGTSESRPGDTRTEVSGLLESVTRYLPDRFVSRWVGYPADYGPASRPDGLSFRESVAIGADNLTKTALTVDGPIVPLGYSQGAAVVRELLHRQATGVGPRLDIRAAGFVADPQMWRGAAYGKPHLPGYGVAGVGGRVSVPAWWIANDRDPIPAAAPDSLLRTVADLTEYMTLTNVVEWGERVLARLLAHQWQNVGFTWQEMLQTGERLNRTAAEVAAYLPWLPIVNEQGGQHTSAYIGDPYMPGNRETGCEVLARLLDAHIHP
ncbi:PE-PPE domain-containing protein [Nocardia carnea]|uniref:PE-PPE domain-containing protein n=1 Tax=Nocardia carnea TaxID=37328 RepID=UPI002454DC20|nr:PE-PPE domain-containing protein [Nocardia carnea]